jgi:hypothetical protein
VPDLQEKSGTREASEYHGLPTQDEVDMKDPLEHVPLRDAERSRFDLFERYEPDWDMTSLTVIIVILLLIALVA